MRLGLVTAVFWLAASFVAAVADQSDPLPGGRTLRRSELRLTQEQKDALGRLEKESDRESDRAKDGLKRLRRDLEHCYRQHTLDTKKIEGIHSAINEAQSRLLLIRFSTQQKLRTILNAEQFATLQRLLHDDEDNDKDRKH